MRWAFVLVESWHGAFPVGRAVAQAAQVDPDAVAEIVRPDLLARIIVVERQHHVFGWMPLQRDAAVDAFVLGVDLRGAILLFEEAGDRFVSEFRIGARRCHLARRVIAARPAAHIDAVGRSEAHTSELKSLMRISYDVLCLKKKTAT